MGRGRRDETERGRESRRKRRGRENNNNNKTRTGMAQRFILLSRSTILKSGTLDSDAVSHCWLGCVNGTMDPVDSDLLAVTRILLTVIS